MKRYLFKIIFLMCTCLICPLSASAEADFKVQKTFKIDGAPLDIAVSERSYTMYVLTTDGIIYVYDFAGALKGQIEVGKHIDGIAPGKSEDTIFIKSKNEKTVQRIVIEFVHDIDIEGAPYKGRDDAPVVITVFSDYQCPACVRLSSKLDQVIKGNKDNIKIVYKNYPLSMHKYARNAAAAALTAHSMGKFREFHEALYANSKQLDDNKVREIAEGLELDPDEFIKQMRSQKIQDKINKDMKDGKKAGLTQTPSVYINGRLLKNTTTEGIQGMINEQLKKLKQLKQ